MFANLYKRDSENLAQFKALDCGKQFKPRS